MESKIDFQKITYNSGIVDTIDEEIMNLRYNFLEFVRDKEIPSATEIIVEWIKKNYFIYTTKDDEKSEMWIYNDGIYTPTGKSEIKKILRNVLDKWYNTFYYNQIVNKIEADTFIEVDKFFVNNYIEEIPVQNGILNIFTKKLSNFTPIKIFFNKLPIRYDPTKQCPQIEQFLKDVLASEDDIKVFYELGGFCLLKEYKFEKAFMFVGNGRNGKDKSLELIKRTLGVENCCSVPLCSLIPDSFMMSEFFGRMANIAGDINNQDLKDTSMFKAMTGRSLLSGQRKFLKPIVFVNHAKFIFACNDLPMVYDNSKGFWDRWVLLEFPYTFVIQEELDKNLDKKNLKLRDEGIIERITTSDELSGLLNQFLCGLDCLIANKTFSNTLGSDEIKNLWIRRSNSFTAFCMDKIEDAYDSFISKKELRKRYSEYCKEHKVNQKSDFVIKRVFEELYGCIESNQEIMGKWEKAWEGIKWK